MALITSAQSGNFNATSTWTGGVVPGVGDEARASTGHTVTITSNATCDEISNAGTGKFVINNGITLTANVTTKTTTAGNLLEFNTAAPAECYIVGNVLASSASGIINGINNLLSGTINITGNLNGNTAQGSQAASNSAGGVINITGNVTGSTGPGLRNTSSGTIIVTGNVEAGLGVTLGNGIWNGSTGTVQIVGSVTASSNIAAIFSTNASSTVRASGSFIHAANGQVPINSPKVLLWSTPLNSVTRYAVDGIGNFLDYFTADNALGQANPSDVRSGVSYASGSLTGSLTVPVRGTISYGVTYGPAMPFSATRSGTTATATLAYSHPYQVGDTFTVSGAFYSDWNGDYTVASVVSGTSITFSVPDTLPASTGAGAVLQTKGTAVLDGASVASAVWSAAARTITGGLVDTATTLTNAPTVPSVVQIRQEMDSNSTKLANLDATISSRSTLTTGDLPSAPTAASVATAVWSAATKEITGGTVTTLTNSPDVPTEAEIASQVRTELSVELGRIDAAVSSRLAPSGTLATVTTLTNAPTVPTAAAIADEVRVELATELARIDAPVSGATAPSAATVATAVRSELSVELARVDQAVSTRLAGSAYTAPANSDVAAIKAKTDALNTERLANVATTAIVGNLLAQANS